MNKIISAYLWAFRNYQSGRKSLESFRKFYPDSDVFINVDYEGDHEEYQRVGKDLKATVTRNNFQLGYCGNFTGKDVGYDCWPREHTFEWLTGLYEACKKTNSEYIILLEEDDFILRPITLLEYEFSIAIHPTAPSPIGWYRPNHIPVEFLKYSEDHGGIGECPGYASGGGCILNRKQFIEAWEYCREFLWEDYEDLRKVSKIIGWVDFNLQFVMMLSNHTVIQNIYLCEHWEVGDIWKDFEIVTGLKDHTLVEI